MKYLGLAMLDGYVYAVGGWEGSSRLDSVERYDPDTNSWASVASLKMAVTSPAVVANEGKNIFNLMKEKIDFETLRLCNGLWLKVKIVAISRILSLFFYQIQN